MYYIGQGPALAAAYDFLIGATSLVHYKMPWYLGDVNRYNPHDVSKFTRCLPTFAIMNEKAIHADENLPGYAAQDQQPAPPSWKWWWRKRVWMPTSVLVLLLVFGVIFGAVMGVKASRSE
jgi:hypothetical protein